jgi:branched-chain amino acid transport system permease protein
VKGRIPAWALVLVGALVCVGLDLGYDAVVGHDRAMKFWLHIVVICAINVLGATSLNVVNGMAGQFSIGHAGFVGLGAYLGGAVAARAGVALGLNLSQLHDNLTLAQSFVIVPVVLLPVIFVCALVGLFVGLPSLRLRGDYLAIVTLGFSEILRLTILGTVEDTATNPVSKAIAALGGSLGYRGPKLEGDFTGVPSVAGPFWTIGLAAFAVFLALRLKRSGFGRALRAVREDEIAAAAVGVDPAKYKVTAFVLAAVGAGVAGALLAIQRDGPGIVSPALMKFDRSFEVITMVILGGSGSVTGAAVGAILYTIVFYASEEGLRIAAGSIDFFAKVDAAALRMAIFAATLVIVMLVRPEGLFGERELGEKKDSGKDRPVPKEPKGKPPSEKDVPGALAS